MVFGHDSPAVAQLFNVALARIDHGLNGEGHAFFKFFARAGFAVVQHLGLFVEYLANAMPTKLAHHRKPMPLGKLLNRMANVTQPHAGFDFHNAVPHGVKGQGAQAFGSNRCVAHLKHAAGVAMPAVFNHGDVDVDNITLFKSLVVRYAVAHLMVNRRANRFGIGLVAAGRVIKWGRNRLLHTSDVVVSQLVQLVGGDARLNVRREKIKNFRGKPPRNAHAVYTGLIFVCDGHV